MTAHLSLRVFSRPMSIFSLLESPPVHKVDIKLKSLGDLCIDFISQSECLDIVAISKYPIPSKCFTEILENKHKNSKVSTGAVLHIIQSVMERDPLFFDSQSIGLICEVCNNTEQVVITKESIRRQNYQCYACYSGEY